MLEKYGVLLSVSHFREDYASVSRALLAVCLLLFSFDLEYAIKMAEENKQVLEPNQTHRLLINVDYDILFIENIYP
jgi:hypothetical protein